MRTSMVTASFLLVGAGAAALAALEPGGGNNLALNGSDTLFEVTQNIITSCTAQFSDFATNKVTYLGGGSGVGAGQMGLGVQELSPMSRAMKNSEYCTAGATAVSEGAAASNAEALLVGIDGVAITANKTNSCQTDATANPSGGAVGLGAASFQVAGTPCHGCTGTTYTLGDPTGAVYANQPSFDALSVIYFGLTHDGFYDCSGNVRKSLVANWNALFNVSCSAAGTGSGTGNCPTGLQHAWRRSDLSGTTDAFVSVLNPPNGSATNNKGAGVTVGIGTLSNVPVGAAQKSNPFCNSADAQTSPGGVSFGGSSDFSDFDPIRTVCSAKDNICEGFQKANSSSRFDGDLGLVLPILVPDATATVFSDFYPPQPNPALPNCNGGCALIPIAKSAAVGATLCPNGQPSYAGFCFLPVLQGSNPPDPRCVSAPSTTCIDTVGRRDGRTFNMITIAESANLATNKRAGQTYQWAFDANNRFMQASYYRVRGALSADPTSSGTGICQEGDDTLDIGCLSDSNNCTIGFAGRSSSSDFNDTPAQIGTLDTTKALAINGGGGFVPPFTPSSVSSDQNLYLENLLNVGQTEYPLARRLYLSTIYGFGDHSAAAPATGNLGGGELELARCYATNAFMNGAITNNGFVTIPANNGVGTPGVECIDYNEAGTSTSSPAPNVQGSGAVAFPGCNLGLTNNDACTALSSRPTDVNGSVVPESL
jgi:hypothetical protein